MATKVAINGFGRIGRNFYRAYLKRRPDFEVVAVNDLADAEVLAHVLKYDSTHGVLDAQVEAGEGEIRVNGEALRVFAEREPEKLPWDELGVEIVVESTGIFTDADKARAAMRVHVGKGRALLLKYVRTLPDAVSESGAIETTPCHQGESRCQASSAENAS